VSADVSTQPGPGLHDDQGAIETSPGSQEVEILRWPEEAARLDALRSACRPRLLLLAPDVAPPDAADCCEDWVRLPASDADIGARAAGVAARAAAHSSVPELRGDGRVRYRDHWVPLSRIEEALLVTLAERFGSLVATDDLRGDDRHPLSAKTLRVHVMRLRRRIEPIGLVIRTVHGRGYVLEAAIEGSDQLDVISV